MKKLPISIFLLALLFSFAACNQQADNQDALENEDLDQENQRTDSLNDQAQNITLDTISLPQFPDSKLTLEEPAENANIESSNPQFKFNVENYQLGEQTENPANVKLANSDQGQHIHFIDNNDPYTAHYEESFTRELSEGNHVVLAFLSRSYHASVKNEDAYVVRKYTIGNSNEELNFDENAPHMFYSRPKGTYTGEDAQSILLDFYLINTDLSANGNRVRATINGRQFMIDEWKPYVINGLPMGETTIKLELLDKDKNLIDSPFNPVTRTITLEPAQNQENQS